jgi:heme/copper-type cytochrome/quinol oxidase subunit 4
LRYSEVEAAVFRKKKQKIIPTFVCPHCGTTIPATSRACPECGSDSETGWSETYYPPGDPYAEEERDERRHARTLRRRTSIVFIAFVTIVIAALITMSVPAGYLYSIALVMAVAVVIVFVRVVMFFARRPEKTVREKSLERELSAMTGRDPALVERLVEFERVRQPDASRAELLERAIDRLARDRSR